MRKKNEFHISLDELEKAKVDSKSTAYDADQLISCGNCQRKSPPDRLRCLYCGSELELTGIRGGLTRLKLRKPELWEKGFNLVRLPGKESVESTVIIQISTLLSIDAKIAAAVLESDYPLPLARVGSEREASVVGTELEKLGVGTRMISDELLEVDFPLTRLRGLVFSEDKIALSLFNTAGGYQVPADDLLLIIPGAIYEQSSDVLEKRAKAGESTVVNASETASDELCLDIYSRKDKIGFRILTRGFDFSCLGDEKGILSGGNLKSLTEKLRGFAPAAGYVDYYPAVREILGAVWEVEHKKDSKGLTRGGIGKFNFGVVSTSSNLNQFNKFSRLQRHLQ